MPMIPQAGMPPPPGMDPGMEAGPPPELMAALMGGAGAGGFAPEQMPPEPPPEPELSPLDHLRQAIEHAQAALTMEPDDADSQSLAKVVQGLYGILAQRQKEEQKMMGDPAMQRVLSRAHG
jgi:hypothetical protein